MKCERRDLAIAKLAGGDLSGWPAARLQRHLDECSRCASLYAELSLQLIRTRESYLATNTATISTIANGVLAHVDQRDRHGHRGRVRIRMAGGAILAAVLIGLAVLQLPSSVPSDQMETPMAMAPIDDSAVPPVQIAPAERAATKHSSVVIRMLTNNPDVVILWLGDSTGGS